jgi:hypothetical protein
MHIDENAANNRAENICWGTQKENLNADGFLDYCRKRTGENHPRKKHQQTLSAEIKTLIPPTEKP